MPHAHSQAGQEDEEGDAAGTGPAHAWDRPGLEDGRAAKMGYLHRNCDKRFTSATLLAGARSVICVALNYRPAEHELAENPSVRIARFAQYEDYHPFIKDQLFQLAEFIKNNSPPAKGEYRAAGRGFSGNP